MTKRKDPKDLAKKPKRLLEIGRPTKYRPEFCKMLEDYFDLPHYREVPETYYNPDGSVKRQAVKLIPNAPMTMGLASWELFDVPVETMEGWGRRYPAFQRSITYAREKRKQMVVANGVAGLYNPIAFKLAAANWFGWHDKQDVSHSETRNVIVRYHMPDLPSPISAPPQALAAPLPALPKPVKGAA